MKGKKPPKLENNPLSMKDGYKRSSRAKPCGNTKKEIDKIQVTSREYKSNP